MISLVNQAAGRFTAASPGKRCASRERVTGDDRRASHGRTGVRKRRGGPMRTLALRRCALVLRCRPRHGNVLRLRGQGARPAPQGRHRPWWERPPSPRAWYGFGGRCVCAPAPALLGSLPNQVSVPEGRSAPLRGGGSPVRQPSSRCVRASALSCATSGVSSLKSPPMLRGIRPRRVLARVWRPPRIHCSCSVL